MLILLSPTKKQAIERVTYQGVTTQPTEVNSVACLIDHLKQYTQKELASLMTISDALAGDAHQAIQTFHTASKNPAILMFQGDAFQQLNASDFTKTDFTYAQKHLLILSGLYGYLKPLDLIAHYRLEMSAPLKVNDTKNLYEFWKEKITNGLNQLLKKHHHRYVINLASDEYFRAVEASKLAAEVITIDFKEYQNKTLKTVGTYAKRARGLMTRYLLKNQISQLDDLKKFQGMHYQFDKNLSTENKIVFVKS